MADKKNIAGKPPSQRQLRVGEMLRERLSEILRVADFEAKVLKKANLTVTEVRISPDLKQATAYIMPLGGAHLEKIVHLLNEDVARLKKLALSDLHLKYTPDLRFTADASFDKAVAMDKLLASDRIRADLADSDDRQD
jgi:ribosome-binding factor A